MHKTYLSRAVTRAMSADHPIGDPFGGPAYGERRDPVSAVISIGTMVAGYGAATAAGATLAATVLGGMAMVGGAMSLIGNVSGNAKLSRIGSIVGMVGGVGLAAGSMGAFALTDPAAAAASAAGSSGPAANLSQSAAPGTQTPTSVDITPVRAPSVEMLPPNAPAPQPAGNLNAPGAAAQGLNAGPGAGAPGLNAGPAPGGLRVPDGAQLARLNANAATPGFLDSLRAGNFMDAAKAAGTGAMALAKANPGAALVMAKAAGGVADWLTGKTDAEIAALEAQTSAMGARGEQIRFEIERERQRRARLNANMASAGPGIQFNPNVTIPQPWQGGLIGGAMGQS